MLGSPCTKKYGERVLSSPVCAEPEMESVAIGRSAAKDKVEKIPRNPKRARNLQAERNLKDSSANGEGSERCPRLSGHSMSDCG